MAKVWYQVQIQDGTQGWAMAAVLTPGLPSTETAGGGAAAITKDGIADITEIRQIEVLGVTFSGTYHESKKTLAGIPIRER